MHAFLIGMKISADPEDISMTKCHVEWESHPQMGIFSYVIMLDYEMVPSGQQPPAIKHGLLEKIPSFPIQSSLFQGICQPSP